jgi:HlyD family secretion protein
MNIKKYWKWAAIIAALLCIAYVLTEEEKPAAPSDVNVASAAYIAVAKGRVDIEGGVIKLAAQRDGIIQQVLVEEGAHVKKDQILAVQDTRQAEIQVGLAKAEYERAVAQLSLLQTRYAFAQRDAKRNSNAAKEGAISGQVADDKRTNAASLKAELDAANASVSVAKAQLNQAEFEIEVRNIRAPFDGRIVKRDAKPGAGLSTLNVTELFQLAPLAPRIVRADIDEQFIDQVKVGMKAEIISETNPDQKWQGEIVRIGEVFGSRKQSDDPNERQDVRVVDTVLSLDDETVRIGQRVLVKIKK